MISCTHYIKLERLRREKTLLFRNVFVTILGCFIRIIEMKIQKYRTSLLTFTKGEEQMSSSTKSQGEVKRWHVILFVTIAGLLTLLVLYGSVRDLLILPGQSGFASVI